MHFKPDRLGKGTQNRNWVKDTQTKVSFEHRKYPIDIQKDISFMMKDGVTLKGRLFMPQASGRSNRWPCLLLANGYGHIDQPREDELSIFFAKHGYAVLHVSLRGSGTSEGTNTLFESYGEDGCELIAWMIRQPWSTGKVGLIGQSLRGISQWLIAKRLPPGLKAMSPEICSPDGYDDLWYVNGTLPGPGRMSRGEPEYPAAIAHRNKDTWWQERTVSSQEMKNIAQSGIAVLFSGGWQDYLTQGNIKAYTKFCEYGGIGKLVVGSEAHSSIERMRPYEFRLCQLLWFDHYMLGKDNGIDREEPVLLFIQGADHWRYESAWPLRGEVRSKFCLSGLPSGSLSGGGDGSLVSAYDEEGGISKSSYAYSPESGPFLPAMRCSIKGIPKIDQASFEAETLRWTSGELAENTEITGHISLIIWASVTAADMDVIVTLSDVSPAGSSVQVTSGCLNASRRYSRSHPVPVRPGEIRMYTIDFMPTSYVFPEGHRFRVSIAGGSCPLPEQQMPQGPGLQPLSSIVTIYHSREYPSSLFLPIIGTQTGVADE